MRLLGEEFRIWEIKWDWRVRRILEIRKKMLCERNGSAKKRRKFKIESKVKSIWTVLENTVYGDRRKGTKKTVRKINVWDEMWVDMTGIIEW